MRKVYTIEEIATIIDMGLFYDKFEAVYYPNGGYNYTHKLADYLNTIEKGNEYGKKSGKVYQIKGEGIKPYNNSSKKLEYYSSEERARVALIKLVKETNKWIDEQDNEDIYGEPMFEKYTKTNKTEYSTSTFRYYIEEINVLD